MLMAVSSSSKLEAQGADICPPTMRRCLVLGEVKPKELMIRFVVGPDGAVVPDLAAKLPGRGLWVSAQRDVLIKACDKNLFARAAKAKVIVPAGLLAQVEDLLAKRCLDLLGLARSAGAVVTGQPQVEHALAHDQLSFVMLAADAGRDCRKKLSRARVVDSGFARGLLGAALGHDHLASVGLKPHPLTKKLEQECARWQGVRAAKTVDANEDWITDEHD